MLVHFIAYWFLFEAFDYFVVLHDYHFKIAMSHHHFSKHMSDDDLRSIVPYEQRIFHDALINGLVPLVSILISFALSLFISIKRKWYWVNPVFVFLAVLSLLISWRLLKIEITPWTFLKYIFRAPGYFFKGSIWFLIINGAVLLAIGLCLFFLKRIIRFIDGKKDAPSILL